MPAVAVFQTDLAGFAARYKLPVGPYVWRHLRRLHGLCALTLAPSSATFLGLRHGRQLSELYASLDVFVHPGAAETFCQSVQEALASGVPVVAAAAGGPLDLVRHGENGWLWPGDDARLLRDQVLSLAGDPALRAELAGRARASVRGRTWEQVGTELLAHYRSVLPAAPVAGAAA